MVYWNKVEEALKSSAEKEAEERVVAEKQRRRAGEVLRRQFEVWCGDLEQLAGRIARWQPQFEDGVHVRRLVAAAAPGLAISVQLVEEESIRVSVGGVTDELVFNHTTGGLVKAGDPQRSMVIDEYFHWIVMKFVGALPK